MATKTKEPKGDAFTLRLSVESAKALELIKAHLTSTVPEGITISRNEAIEFSLLETAKHIGDKDHDRNH